jgi:hypothetical protein
MHHKTAPRSTRGQAGMLAFVSPSSALATWVGELEQAARQPLDAEARALLGMGVVLEHHDSAEPDAAIADIARRAGMTLIRVARDTVASGFPAWAEALPEDKPALVWLEPGSWMGPEFDGADAISPGPRDEVAEWVFRQTFARFLDAHRPAVAHVFVTTAPHFNALAPELRLVGRFDRLIDFPDLDDAGRGRMFIAEVGEQAFDPSVHEATATLGALLRCECDERHSRSLLQLTLRRHARRHNQPIRLQDVVEHLAYGITEDEPLQVTVAERRAAAAHEAGHAVTAWLDGSRPEPPLYASIHVRRSSMGIVVSPVDTGERSSRDRTYADLVHEIRVKLAGRAAEHLILGADAVSSTGAQSDLVAATRLGRVMLGVWGLPFHAGSDESASANLMVAPPSAPLPDDMRLRRQVPRLLQREFLAVLKLLCTHRLLVEAVTEALMRQSVLVREDFFTIAASVGGPDR